MKTRRFAATAAVGTLLSLSAGTSVALAATPAPYPPPGVQQAFNCTNPAGNQRGHRPNCYEGSTSTSVASPGSSFTFSGPAVFAAGETLQLWMFSSGEQIGTINANSAGSFSTTVTVPNLPPGAHKVEAVGNANNTIVVADFTVPAAAAAASGGASSGLPFTGADVLPLTSAGAGLVLAGGLTVFLVRRRRPRSGHAA